jgi:hypothetical protein
MGSEWPQVNCDFMSLSSFWSPWLGPNPEHACSFVESNHNWTWFCIHIYNQFYSKENKATRPKKQFYYIVLSCYWEAAVFDYWCQPKHDLGFHLGVDFHLVLLLLGAQLEQYCKWIIEFPGSRFCFPINGETPASNWCSIWYSSPAEPLWYRCFSSTS